MSNAVCNYALHRGVAVRKAVESIQSIYNASGVSVCTKVPFDFGSTAAVETTTYDLNCAGRPAHFVLLTDDGDVAQLFIKTKTVPYLNGINSPVDTTKILVLPDHPEDDNQKLTCNGVEYRVLIVSEAHAAHAERYRCDLPPNWILLYPLHYTYQTKRGNAVCCVDTVGVVLPEADHFGDYEIDEKEPLLIALTEEVAIAHFKRARELESADSSESSDSEHSVLMPKRKKRAAAESSAKPTGKQRAAAQ